MKNKIIILIIFVLGIFTACEDIVEVDLGDEVVDLYAVEAKITTEHNPYVYLYKSQHVDNGNDFTGISGATVTISDDSQPPNEIELTESSELKGLYLAGSGQNYIGEIGKTYTVRIEVNDVIMTAQEFLAPVEPIDSIQVHSSLRGDHRFLGVFTYGPEPEGQGQYYKWDIIINDSLLSNSDNLVIASDELVDGNYVNGFEIFTDFHNPDEPSERIINVGDTVVVKQTSISSFAYNFYYQMFNQGQTGGLFSVPPANIESNFTSSNGEVVLGLFTAHDVSTSNSIIIDQSIEDQLRD